VTPAGGPLTAGVYGGGRMGAGIAHLLLAGGSAVTVVETDDAAAASAKNRVVTSLATAEAKGSLETSAAELADRLSVTTDPAALAGAELVIEAVPESVELKQQVLRAVEAVAPQAFLASNTSSLSIDELAGSLQRPYRLIGLHFFNPVPVSDLVEIVVGPRTSADLVRRAARWVVAWERTGILVTDSPGFASSRLGVALALEAMRMLEDGVASAADIDTAMTLGYRHPVGPLRTTDIVGLDVRLAIAEHLARELGPRFEPPDILRDLVAAGHLGRKTGQGFYPW
jgi:3-hydroxybutyryl-CoA dehydrogenase